MIKEVEILLIRPIKLVHNPKDIFFYYISTVREKSSNVSIRPRGLLFEGAQHHCPDFLLSERHF
jgi:hypothetical protein